MAYQTRFLLLMDHLRQEGRFDEAHFRRTAQEFIDRVEREFAGLLTVDRRQELLERQLFFIIRELILL